MNLPLPPQNYDRVDQQQTRIRLEQADRQNVKRGEDIEMASARIFLQSPDGTRFYLTASDLGILTLTAA